MRLGLVFECGSNGPDKQVCEHIIRKFMPQVEIAGSVGLDNKPKLLTDCGEEVKALFEIDRCERVVIIWDLYPAWGRDKAKPCRKTDCDRIRASLNNAQVEQLDKIELVCIEKELEDWLLVNGQVLSKLLSKPHRPVSIPDQKKFIDRRNPKTVMTKIYVEHRQGRRYIDYQDAIKIVKEFEKKHFDKLVKHSHTFRRFVAKVSPNTETKTETHPI